jgi:hypothetical protein
VPTIRTWLAIVLAQSQSGYHARFERLSWQVANPGSAEVGEHQPGCTPKTLCDLLGDEPPDHQKCAFAVGLSAHVETTNGSGTLTQSFGNRGVRGGNRLK